MSKSIALAILAFALSHQLSGAVDCGNPRNRQERVVCANPELLNLDRQLASEYQKALAGKSAVERPHLEMDQRSWEESSGGCWDRVDCIKKRYTDRIAALQGIGLTGAQMGQVQAVAAAKRQADEHVQQEKARTDAEGALAEAQPRFDRLNGEKERLTAALRRLEDMGPLPTVEPTVPPSRIMGRLGGGRVGRGGESGNAIVVERMNAESAKIEEQLPTLRDEFSKRQNRAISYARQTLQKYNLPIPQVRQLAILIENSASSADGVLSAYEAAKKLDAALQALSAAKERAGQIIASAKAELGTAAKYPNDPNIVNAAKMTTETTNELSAKVQSVDPTDTQQIKTLADRLQAQASKVNAFTREKAVMSTATGKRVYDGCYTWAKGGGLIGGTPVRFFKDEETNKAAEMAANPGEPFCRCVAVQIGGDNAITEAGKLEIAHQLETKDRADTQVAVVFAAASLKCQMKSMNEMTGR